MHPALAALHSDVLAQVQSELVPSTGITPAGAAAFPIPGIDAGPLVTAGVNFALDQLARQFGGHANDYVESHRAEILAIVPKSVLGLAQSILDELSAGK